MRLDIRGPHLVVTPALQRHVERRFDFALGRFWDRISHVTVWLEDVNGPRGGLDMRCKVEVQRPRGKTVWIEDTDADLYVAVTRSFDRAAEAVRRDLSRVRHHGAKELEKQRDWLLTG